MNWKFPVEIFLFTEKLWTTNELQIKEIDTSLSSSICSCLRLCLAQRIAQWWVYAAFLIDLIEIEIAFLYGTRSAYRPDVFIVRDITNWKWNDENHRRWNIPILRGVWSKHWARNETKVRIKEKTGEKESRILQHRCSFILNLLLKRAHSLFFFVEHFVRCASACRKYFDVVKHRKCCIWCQRFERFPFYYTQ